MVSADNLTTAKTHWELGHFEYFLSEEDFEELVQNETQYRWEIYNG